MATAAAPKPIAPMLMPIEGDAPRLRERATRTPLTLLSSAPPGGKALDAHKAEAAYVGYHKTFHDRLGVAPSIYKQVATVVETDNVVDIQLWLSANPTLRPWIGPKELSKYRVEAHQIVTKPHEASVEVAKRDIDNDRFGMYKPRINSLADAYPRALDKLAIAMLVGGVQGTALGSTYDGQNLIDTDHTVSATGGVAQSNKVTGAFTETVYETARTRLRRLRNENNEPINQGKRTKLLVGPQNEKIAREILEKGSTADGDNLNRGRSDLIVSDWLDAGDLTVYGPTGPVTITVTGLEWFILVDGSTSVIIHEKETPDLLAVEEGYFPFMNAKYLYGIEAEFGGGYGLWQEIVGGPGA